MPILSEWQAALDPTGRYALLIGYRAIHLVDLLQMTTRALIADSRSDRAGAFAPDGRRAVVLDGYGERLHWIELDGAPRVSSHQWRCPRSMRGELVVVLGADGVVGAVGSDLDDAPLRAVWLDGRSGSTLHDVEIAAERLQTSSTATGLRFVPGGSGLHVSLDDPEAQAIEVSPEPSELRRVPPAWGSGARWRVARRGGQWLLSADGVSASLPIPRPREALRVVEGRGSGTGPAWVAVALDGRVQVYDARTGEPLGERIEPPGRSRFSAVRAMRLTDDRLWVFGEARSSPFAPDPGALVAGYRFDGERWHALGAIIIADRKPAPRRKQPSRGQRMSNVYVRGRQLTVEELEAAGITFVGDKDPEADQAQARFARAPGDRYDRELPVVRTVAGFFGRLDDDCPIGPHAAGPFERPALAHALMRGESPSFDAPTAAALQDWRERLAFWMTEQQWSKPAALSRLMSASAGLGDLLPEIVHRTRPRKGGRVPRANALCRAAERMHRPSSVEREDTIFREMLAREERRLRSVLLSDRLRSACPSLGEGLIAAAVKALGQTVELVADAAEADPPSLKLVDVEAIDVLLDLLVAAQPDLALSALELSGTELDDDGLGRLVAGRWPHLRRLSVAGTAITDRGALHLAAAASFGALEAIDLAETAVTAGGRAALQWSPRLPALTGELSLLDGWVALLGMAAPDPAALTAAIEGLWSATAGQGSSATLGLSPGARVAWQLDAEGPGLAIEGVAVSSTALEALVAAERMPELARLGLRRCQLDDRAAPPLIRLVSAVAPAVHLDLSGNRLGLESALALGERAADFTGTLVATDNPLPAAGWGALRGALGRRLIGAPEDAAAQLAAMTGVERIPISLRGAWLGRALAEMPGLAPSALDALDQVPDPGRRRLLLDAALPEATARPSPSLWQALTDAVLALSKGDATRWQLGPVECEVDGHRLRMRHRRPLTDQQLQIEAEPDASRLRKLLSGQDVLTGDDAFDQIALIAGDPAIALAVLDPEVRAELGAWLPMGLTLRGGVIEAPAPDAAAIAQLALLMARLTPPEAPLAVVWARRLADEPNPGAAVRLARALVAQAPPVDVSLLDAAAMSTIEAAREILGEALARRLDREAVGELSAGGAAAALGAAPSALRPALVERLRAIGDERAVAPLTAIANAFFGGAELKAKARRAVEAIIERQGGLRAGGLTVVARGPAGALSEAAPSHEDER